MLAWPFSGRKDRVPSLPNSVDSGYETGTLPPDPEESSVASSVVCSRASESVVRPLRRITRRVPKEQLEKLKGFKLTFGGPLIQHIRSRPPQKGQHQVLLIDMKYIGDSPQDARLTIIISCHPAYEKAVNSFLRDHRVSIESFFHPGGSSRDIFNDVHILVHAMPPTALAKILCQRPDRSRPGLQLVGERLSYQSEDGFHEATFGGFVAINYDIGRWSVFGLTTAHQAGWELDDYGTYSVLSHIIHIDRQLDDIEDISDWGQSRKCIASLRSALKQWARFELEPIHPLQSGDYIERRRKYVTAARNLLRRCQDLTKRLKVYRSADAAMLGDEDDDSESGSEASTDLLSYTQRHARRILQFLKRHAQGLGHQVLASDIAEVKHAEKRWKSCMEASFDTVKKAWTGVHESTLSDDLTGAGDIVAQSTDTPIAADFANFDWALIRIPELDRELAAAVSAPGARKLQAMDMTDIEPDDEVDEKPRRLMLLNSGHQFAQADYVANVSYICVPPGKDFVEVIAIPSEQFGSDLSKGDSGSWVLDESGRVLGHLIAQDAFGDALIMPMAAILQDIQQKMDVEVAEVPFEPVSMAVADRPANSLEGKQESRGRGADRTITAFESLSLAQSSIDHIDTQVDQLSLLEGWRQETRRKWDAAKREWELSTVECEQLSRAYNRVKDRLGAERLTAILDYQWTVQEAYQRKAAEDNHEEDKARWSEQRARWVYQDELFVNRNQHWKHDWWLAYMQEWSTNLDFWAAVNARLRTQADSFRRCIELLEFHYGRQPPATAMPIDIPCLSAALPRRDDPVIGVSPRWSLSQRPPLSLAPLNPPRPERVPDGRSVDSGYGSRSASPSASSSSCDVEAGGRLSPNWEGSPRFWRRRREAHRRRGAAIAEQDNDDEVYYNGLFPLDTA